jgi:hypothetical protein
MLRKTLRAAHQELSASCWLHCVDVAFHVLAYCLSNKCRWWPQWDSFCVRVRYVIFIAVLVEDLSGILVIDKHYISPQHHHARCPGRTKTGDIAMQLAIKHVSLCEHLWSNQSNPLSHASDSSYNM